MAEVERILSVTELPIDQIEVSSRLRPVSEAGVEAIKASILETGILKDDLIVRRMKAGEPYRLIAGRHRLEAVRQLGWERVPVKAFRCSDTWARIVEIDDNLAGSELTALDTAVFLAERKRLYEKLHPEAKAAAGAELAAKRWHAADIVSVASFAKASAEKFNMTERHVQRLVKAGSALDPEDVELLRRAPKPVSLKDLQDLGRIGDPPVRRFVCAALSKGEAPSVRAAQRAWAVRDGIQPPPRPEWEVKAAKLVDAFVRAPKRARREFVRRYQKELRALLADLDARADEGDGT